ncbi:sensor histidine kinase [Polyangium sp. 6x1]|uniref:sensor histidine kinase n=1 Tax=Polyangium sp. 6x1 TaxID=3042689 RepID=UPI002482C431|nr:sensor histidine kinase [Polyangium sp. 6x1]
MVRSARASSRDRSIAQFYHSRWTVKDGAPGQISALAQTRDGFLWLAAAATLYRFDGVRFEHVEPLDGEPFTVGIQTLHASPDGGLWLGFQQGGAAYFKDGHVTRHGEAQGLSPHQLSSFAIDADGVVWTGGRSAGLLRLEGGRWHSVGDDWGFPSRQATYVFVDRDGTLWVATENTLVFLPKGSRTFRKTGARVKWVGRIAQASDGSIWITELDGNVRPVARANGELLDAPASIDVLSAGMVFDPEGSLWMSTLGEGMRRLPHPELLGDRQIGRLDPAAEIFTEKEGLSADYAWPLLQDREGNIWVGTSGGLDRFRHSSLVLAEFPRGAHDFALAAGDDGAIWAGTTNRPLMRLHDRQVELTELDADVRCAYRDPDGTVWLGTSKDLWRIEGNRPVRVAALPETAVSQQVQAMTKDASGALWVAQAAAGLLRWKDGVWTRMEEPLGLAPEIRVFSATTDAEDRVWLGSRDNTIIAIDHGVARHYGAADGLHLGTVISLRAGKRLWAGGEHGLAHFDGHRFHPFGVADKESFRGVAGILEMPDGGLWLHAVPGIFHIPADEVARAVADSTYLARGERFDFLDGLPARPTLLRPLPTAVQGTDGRLWFATSNGVVWIDPARIFRNPVPPPVAIRSVHVNGRRLAPSSSLTLPERATSIEIDYTALSFTIPERVRFRYRLEGVDEAWQDVGARREAYYTTLDPGHYRFRVIAANNDGVWNETGATLDLTLPPAFFQTWWFRALSAAAVLLGLWAAYLLRLRKVRAHMRSLLEERHRERERIARELHDTLLQGFQGLILRFQAAVEKLPASEPARAAMEKALDRADEVQGEARARVKDLRAASERVGELSSAFTRVGEELAQDGPVEFHVSVEGQPPSLDAIVRDEVFRIGREALLNAFHHAGAQRIEVELVYDDGELCLRVRDDGCGVDAELLEAGGRPGHWGLPGMRERARRIGAQLEIGGRGDAGTVVELRVPAAVAYRGDPKRAFRHRLWRVVRGGR